MPADFLIVIREDPYYPSNPRPILLASFEHNINAVNVTHRSVAAGLAPAHDAIHWTHCPIAGEYKIHPDAMIAVAPL
jgi:hypothetical protein